MNNKSLEEQRKQLQDNNKSKYCSNKISSVVERTIKTVMIGALDDFEKGFGELWGHGTDSRDKSEEEIKEHEIWMKIRESILDRGNNGIKICKKELNRCHITDYDNRPFKYTFKERDE